MSRDAKPKSDLCHKKKHALPRYTDTALMN